MWNNNKSLALCFAHCDCIRSIRWFALRRAPTDVFDRSFEGGRQQSLLCGAVCAPAQVALGVVSGLVMFDCFRFAFNCSLDLVSSIVGFLNGMPFRLMPPCFVGEMQDSSENSANAKTSFQIASMDVAGNVVVWTVVEKQVCGIIMCIC